VSLKYDLDADVCVIGGGLAGLTAAREVARRGWSVVVLEAGRVAAGASGRNSGVVLPGFAAPLEAIVERIGAEATRTLTDLSQSGVTYIRETLAATAEDGEDGAIEADGWLDVSKWPDASGAAARVDLLARMGIEAEAWPVERVRDVLRTSHYFGAVYLPGAFAINPVAYAARLCRAVLEAGVRIFENTEVTAVDLAGVRKRIMTSRGRVRASHVVLAGNVRLAGIVPPLAGTLIPVTAHVGVTRPLGERLAHAVAFRGAVTPSRHHHYRVVGGDRLLWSGTAGTMWPRRSLERVIATAYPQLGKVRFEYFSAAPMSFAVHGMPQIGEVSRGVWVAGAFGGQGLNTSAMAGNLIASAIVERDDTWRCFQPFELVWAGGATGRAVVRAATSWRRCSEAALALAARQREEFRHSSREQVAGADKKPEKPAATPTSAAAARSAARSAVRLAAGVGAKVGVALPSSAAGAVPALQRALKGVTRTGAGKPETGKPETAKPE
jgi:glycine/D-amino acid oxidase-like deaminating enzyme